MRWNVLIIVLIYHNQYVTNGIRDLDLYDIRVLDISYNVNCTDKEYGVQIPWPHRHTSFRDLLRKLAQLQLTGGQGDHQ